MIAGITYGTWRDRLVQGSFRGAKFFITDHEYSFGRRTKVYERWKNDFATTRDHGGKAEYFTLNGFVINNANNKERYWEDRLQLLRALKKGDWGILMHPYLGKLWVKVFDEQIMRESTDEGGMAIFTMKFVQSRAPVLLPKTLSPLKNVDGQAGFTIAAALDDVTETMTTAAAGTTIRAASLYKDSLLDGIKGSLSKMSTALSKVKNVVSSVVNESQNLIASTISTIEQYLDTPCEMMQQMNQAADGFKNICGLGEDSIEDILFGACSGNEQPGGQILDGISVPQSLGESIVENIIGETLGYDVEDDLVPAQLRNAQSILNATQIMLLSIACQILIRTVFLQRKNYEALLNLVQNSFDYLLNRIGSATDTTTLFVATEDMRDVFFANALAQLEDSASQVEYKVPPTIKTSLHIAYDRYNDLDRDNEIQALNPTIDHPGFLPQGATIEVLDE